MSDFNPELWGLRIRHAAGLSNPPPEPRSAPQRWGIHGPHNEANLVRDSGTGEQTIITQFHVSAREPE